MSNHVVAQKYGTPTSLNFYTMSARNLTMAYLN